MVSDVLRMELAPFGIDVVEVQPGGVKSSITDSGSHDLERFRDESSRYHAMYEGIKKRAEASQAHAMPTAEFARRLVSECLADPAPRLIRLGGRVEELGRLALADPVSRDATLAAMFHADRPAGREGGAR
jgi:NAD(P)-dependent dehydrogenase (short-subunit alcohol dehydrogenase family)